MGETGEIVGHGDDDCTLEGLNLIVVRMNFCMLC